jgi:hypothetical protein
LRARTPTVSLAASTPANPAHADDGLQLVRMSAVEVASGAEHPWAAAESQYLRPTRKLALQGPRDPAGEVERALVELP